MIFKIETIDIIFTKVYLKLHLNVVNRTTDSLSFDRLKKEVKIYLLICVLDEIRHFLINELFYRARKVNSGFKADKFFELILVKVKKNLEKKFFFFNQMKIITSEVNWVIKYLEIEEGELFNIMLCNIYFQQYSDIIYSTSHIDKLKLVTSILENLVLKITNILIYMLFLDIEAKKLFYEQFFNSNLDILRIQKNNLYWQAYITSTFLRPKYIYYNLYNLKTLDKHGIVIKVIYLPNLVRREKYKFSNIQSIILVYFELIDFFYPRIFQALKNSRATFQLIFR
jgi:hypothetical protein